MRVSDLGIFNRYLRYDKIQQEKIQKYTTQLSSGKKILQPSNAAIDNARVLRLKTITSEIDGYIRNMDLIETSQSIAETTLSNILDAVEEAKIDFIQLLNTGLIDGEDANIFKDYFINLRDYIVKQANVKIGDNYLFAGIKSQQEPFNAKGIYQGETKEAKAPIASATEVKIKFNGEEYLSTVNSGVWNDINSDGVVDKDELSQKIGIVKALDDIISIIDDSEIYKLHGKNSELGYNSANDPLISPTEADGTVTIDYGSLTLNINYDSDTADITNPSTLNELVDAINNDPNNLDENGNPKVKAYTFKDRDGVVRFGVYGPDSQKKLEINITGDLNKHLGNFDYILDQIDKNYNNIQRYRSMIGTERKLIEDIKEQHETFKVNFKELTSKLEDADLAETIVKLEEAKAAYEATIASYAQNKDLSLLNYFKK